MIISFSNYYELLLTSPQAIKCVNILPKLQKKKKNVNFLTRSQKLIKKKNKKKKTHCFPFFVFILFKKNEGYFCNW
jgi:hypothetical protein